MVHLTGLVSETHVSEVGDPIRYAPRTNVLAGSSLA